MEQWKDIQGYEWLYQVSNLWRVKSLKWWKIRILKLIKSRIYYVSWLHINNTFKMYRVHRLVAIHFIPNPFNLPCVCHKDETLDERWMLYNWEDNLFWWTQSDNSQDRDRKWRSWTQWKVWKDCPKSKPVHQYTKEWEFIKEWESVVSASLQLNINKSTIAQCCRMEYWRKTAGGFIWKYV